MRLAHHLIRHPSGVWHFRLVVPRRLHAVLGLKIIKRSLGTRDPTAARLLAYALGGHYAQAFAEARGKGVGKEWDDYLASLKRFEIGEGTIKTDGTAEDAAAQRALETMLKISTEKRKAAEAAARTPLVRREMPTIPIPPKSKDRPWQRAGRAAGEWATVIKADTLRKTHSQKMAAVEGFAQHYGAERSLMAPSRLVWNGPPDDVSLGGCKNNSSPRLWG